VRKVIRGHETEFKYERLVQPAPKSGEWVAVLTGILEAEQTSKVAALTFAAIHLGKSSRFEVSKFESTFCTKANFIFAHSMRAKSQDLLQVGHRVFLSRQSWVISLLSQFVQHSFD
jgi:hypothetical protein